MDNEYTAKTRMVTARPRSERLRRLGASGSGVTAVVTSSSVISGENTSSGAGSVQTKEYKAGSGLKLLNGDTFALNIASGGGLAVSGGALKVDSTISGKSPAPILRINGLVNAETNVRTRWLQVTHPLAGASGYEIVLMVYARRNGGKNRNGNKVHRTGWALATGAKRTLGACVLSKATSLDYIAAAVVSRYGRVYGVDRSEPASMTYEEWQALDGTGGRGFHGKMSGTDKPSGHYKRFGVAIRWTNPEFASLTGGGSLTDNTASTNSGSAVIKRWLYSDVAPLDVYMCAGTASGDYKYIGIGLAGVGAWRK